MNLDRKLLTLERTIRRWRGQGTIPPIDDGAVKADLATLLRFSEETAVLRNKRCVPLHMPVMIAGNGGTLIAKSRGLGKTYPLTPAKEVITELADFMTERMAEGFLWLPLVVLSNQPIPTFWKTRYDLLDLRREFEWIEDREIEWDLRLDDELGVVFQYANEKVAVEHKLMSEYACEIVRNRKLTSGAT